ncbi:hypothetical protein CYMTET_9163, partial [Cymbomonas tetramitiformis]
IVNALYRSESDCDHPQIVFKFLLTKDFAERYATDAARLSALLDNGDREWLEAYEHVDSLAIFLVFDRSDDDSLREHGESALDNNIDLLLKTIVEENDEINRKRVKSRETRNGSTQDEARIQEERARLLHGDVDETGTYRLSRAGGADMSEVIRFERQFIDLMLQFVDLRGAARAGGARDRASSNAALATRRPHQQHCEDSLRFTNIFCSLRSYEVVKPMYEREYPTAYFDDVLMPGASEWEHKWKLGGGLLSFVVDRSHFTAENMQCYVQPRVPRVIVSSSGPDATDAAARRDRRANVQATVRRRARSIAALLEDDEEENGGADEMEEDGGVGEAEAEGDTEMEEETLNVMASSSSSRKVRFDPWGFYSHMRAQYAEQGSSTAPSALTLAGGFVRLRRTLLRAALRDVGERAARRSLQDFELASLLNNLMLALLTAKMPLPDALRRMLAPFWSTVERGERGGRAASASLRHPALPYGYTPKLSISMQYVARLWSFLDTGGKIASLHHFGVVLHIAMCTTICLPYEERRMHLIASGNAATGKSYLMQVVPLITIPACMVLNINRLTAASAFPSNRDNNEQNSCYLAYLFHETPPALLGMASTHGGRGQQDISDMTAQFKQMLSGEDMGCRRLEQSGGKDNDRGPFELRDIATVNKMVMILCMNQSPNCIRDRALASRCSAYQIRPIHRGFRGNVADSWEQSLIKRFPQRYDIPLREQALMCERELDARSVDEYDDDDECDGKGDEEEVSALVSLSTLPNIRSALTRRRVSRSQAEAGEKQRAIRIPTDVATRIAEYEMDVRSRHMIYFTLYSVSCRVGVLQGPEMADFYSRTQKFRSIMENLGYCNDNLLRRLQDARNFAYTLTSHAAVYHVMSSDRSSYTDASNFSMSMLAEIDRTAICGAATSIYAFTAIVQSMLNEPVQHVIRFVRTLTTVVGYDPHHPRRVAIGGDGGDGELDERYSLIPGTRRWERNLSGDAMVDVLAASFAKDAAGYYEDPNVCRSLGIEPMSESYLKSVVLGMLDLTHRDERREGEMYKLVRVIESPEESTPMLRCFGLYIASDKVTGEAEDFRDDGELTRVAWRCVDDTTRCQRILISDPARRMAPDNVTAISLPQYPAHLDVPQHASECAVYAAVASEGEDASERRASRVAIDHRAESHRIVNGVVDPNLESRHDAGCTCFRSAWRGRSPPRPAEDIGFQRRMVHYHLDPADVTNVRRYHPTLCDKIADGEIAETECMSQFVEPLVVVKQIYRDVRIYVCPLCSDVTEHSLEELVNHVREGKCAAVTGRPVKTDEASLAHTREIWEREICETLQHASFVDVTERFIEQEMETATRLHEEEKERLISSHQREIQRLRGVNDVCKREMRKLEKDAVSSVKRAIQERDDLRKEIGQLQNKIQNECKKRDSRQDHNRGNKRQYT